MIGFKLKWIFLKKGFFLLFVSLVTLSFVNSSNVGKTLPNESLKTINGNKVDVSTFSKPAIISFWSTTCIPCIKELNAINEKYESWKKEHKVEVYAISTDDDRFASRIPLIVSKKKWRFPVFKDQQKKLFKALDIKNNPYTIIIDKQGKIVYEHNSYKEGDEKELINIIKNL